MPVSGPSLDDAAVGDLLTAAKTRPSALLIQGEAGIGKTTFWQFAVDRARERGFRVLTARASQAETVHAYATVGDLVADVEPTLMARIPDLQHRALDRVLMRASGEGPEANQQMVAAAFMSVIEALSANAPPLIAVDDVHWLDSSSRAVMAFAVRRLKNRVGVLFTEREEHDTVNALSWLQLATGDEIGKVRVSPLGLHELHALIKNRIGRSFPHPTMVRIAEVSGGNPLYALELARAIDAEGGGEHQVFPRSLANLVRMRIARLDGRALDVLVAAACLPQPTVDMLVGVTGTTVEEVVELLEEPESAGIIALDGNRVSFTHPVLARGVYANAAPARRRYWHRAWSEALSEPESKARHLALAATSSDQETLAALDAAAAVVRGRGAPAAAAELLDLAIGLGGDTPMRRFAAAEHHLRSGDAARAQEVLKPGIDQMEPGPFRALMMFGYAVILMHTEGYSQAADVLYEAIDDATGDPTVLVEVLMMLAFAQINEGIYETAPQHARRALAEAEAAAQPVLISQALASWAYVSFHCGSGYDETAMTRALELEDHAGDVPIPFRASAVDALLMAWTGRLEESATALDALTTQLVRRGGEIEMLFVAYNSVLVNVWLGRYVEARHFAEDTFRRVEEIGGSAIRGLGLAMRGWVAVHAGHEQEARADLTAALESAARSESSSWWVDLALTGLARLEVSAGRHAEALNVLAPLLAVADTVPNTEISKMEYLPDAIEAMVISGRFEEAEVLIDRLERDGRELGRAWMVLVAARCRGMWLAASGDVEAAVRVVAQAADAHRGLRMPLEHARTQLLLGQLYRRLRQKQAAAAALDQALRTFEQLDNPLWAARVHAERARVNVRPGHGVDLTPSEQRVAELAAEGLSNREIAAAVYVSAKTVESVLTRVYRKLGVRSRAMLGRRMLELAPRDETLDN
ncbi:MAG TPA: AAA family ATPase [Mycobacterium sp.]|nr:AAA family ATPase [Mycobacterium sp.]